MDIDFIPHCPLDVDVGDCGPATPSVSDFFDAAVAACTHAHRITSTRGDVHLVVSAAARIPAYAPLTTFIVLGRGDFDYVGHYLLDLSGAYVRVVSAWRECARACDDDSPDDGHAPLARMVYEVFAKPLHLWSALVHSPQKPVTAYARDGHVRPMLRMGCYTRPFALEEAVAVSRRRRLAAIVIGRAARCWQVTQRVRCLEEAMDAMQMRGQ